MKQSKMDVKQAAKAKQTLETRYNSNSGSIKLAEAPGRVNLIGEHTDYNGGFVLPVAINRTINVAARARDDTKVRAYALDYEQEGCFDLDAIEYDEDLTWLNYLQGVTRYLQQRHQLQGADLVVKGNVPRGAGLSSSAALEVSTAYAFKLINDLDLNRVEMAKLCRQAENEFVGVSCGIMDQFISVLGRKDHALFIDCGSLNHEPVAIDHDQVKLMIADTNVQRNLADSKYNERKEECEQGVQIFNQQLDREIKHLGDVSPTEFEKYKGNLQPTIRKRCEHVIYENRRVEDTVSALEAGDIGLVGELMLQSHHSLRQLYQVSCDELDLMVELAKDIDGVFGSRMTGAGFGGCTVSLVKEKAVDQFKEEVGERYRQETGIEPAIYSCNIEQGAHQLQIE